MVVLDPFCGWSPNWCPPHVGEDSDPLGSPHPSDPTWGPPEHKTYSDTVKPGVEFGGGDGSSDSGAGRDLNNPSFSVVPVLLFGPPRRGVYSRETGQEGNGGVGPCRGVDQCRWSFGVLTRVWCRHGRRGRVGVLDGSQEVRRSPVEVLSRPLTPGPDRALTPTHTRSLHSVYRVYCWWTPSGSQRSLTEPPSATQTHTS